MRDPVSDEVKDKRSGRETAAPISPPDNRIGCTKTTKTGKKGGKEGEKRGRKEG